jgi:hypothetical protein
VAEIGREDAPAVAFRRRVVATALEREGEAAPEDDRAVYARAELAKDARAATDLEAELRRHGGSLQHILGMHGKLPATDRDATVEEAGMLAWDRRLAAYLAPLGPHGAELAAVVTEKAAERWAAAEAAPPGDLWSLWTGGRGTCLGSQSSSRWPSGVTWWRRACADRRRSCTP